METGNVQFAPDYKSAQRPPLNLVFEAGMQRQRQAAERSRLEREVIEAAKAEIVASDEYVKNLTRPGWERCVQTRVARQAAVRTLLEFESTLRGQA